MSVSSVAKAVLAMRSHESFLLQITNCNYLPLSDIHVFS